MYSLGVNIQRLASRGVISSIADLLNECDVDRAMEAKEG
jgi:hypothetical protein